jgi:hypothetical protein
MANLRRSKAELYGIVERIVQLFHGDRLKIDEITETLNAEGYEIGRSSVHRTLQDDASAGEMYARIRAEAAGVLESVRSDPNLDVTEAAGQFAAALLLKEVSGLQSLQFDDHEKLVLAISRMMRAQTGLGRLKMEYSKGFEAARNRILSELAEHLRSDPATLARLRAVVEAMEPEG